MKVLVTQNINGRQALVAAWNTSLVPVLRIDLTQNRLLFEGLPGSLASNAFPRDFDLAKFLRLVWRVELMGEEMLSVDVDKIADVYDFYQFGL